MLEAQPPTNHTSITSQMIKKGTTLPTTQGKEGHKTISDEERGLLWWVWTMLIESKSTRAALRIYFASEVLVTSIIFCQQMLFS